MRGILPFGHRIIVYKAESTGLMRYDVATGRSTPLTTDPSDESPSLDARR